MTLFYKYWVNTVNTREYYHNTYEYLYNTCEYWAGEYILKYKHEYLDFAKVLEIKEIRDKIKKLNLFQSSHSLISKLIMYIRKHQVFPAFQSLQSTLA